MPTRRSSRRADKRPIGRVLNCYLIAIPNTTGAALPWSGDSSLSWTTHQSAGLFRRSSLNAQFLSTSSAISTAPLRSWGHTVSNSRRMFLRVCRLSCTNRSIVLASSRSLGRTLALEPRCGLQHYGRRDQPAQKITKAGEPGVRSPTRAEGIPSADFLQEPAGVFFYLLEGRLVENLGHASQVRLDISEHTLPTCGLVVR